jgi:hypothetical protein
VAVLGGTVGCFLCSFSFCFLASCCWFFSLSFLPLSPMRPSLSRARRVWPSLWNSTTSRGAGRSVPVCVLTSRAEESALQRTTVPRASASSLCNLELTSDDGRPARACPTPVYRRMIEVSGRAGRHAGRGRGPLASGSAGPNGEPGPRAALHEHLVRRRQRIWKAQAEPPHCVRCGVVEAGHWTDETKGPLKQV